MQTLMTSPVEAPARDREHIQVAEAILSEPDRHPPVLTERARMVMDGLRDAGSAVSAVTVT